MKTARAKLLLLVAVGALALPATALAAGFTAHVREIWSQLDVRMGER